jgi:PAS domain S-box-containing protein
VFRAGAQDYVRKPFGLDDLEARLSAVHGVSVEHWALIDQTRRAERTVEELDASLRFLDAVLQTAATLVVVANAEGRIERFNRACEELTGWSETEIVGQRIIDVLVVPDDASAMSGLFDDLRNGRAPYCLENRWRQRGGGERLISWSNATIRNDDGTLRHIIGTGMDIPRSGSTAPRCRRAKGCYGPWLNTCLTLACSSSTPTDAS